MGRKITFLNVSALLAIVMFGALSILLTRDILKNSYHIEVESGHVTFFNSIHNDIYRLVLAMQHFIMDMNPDHSNGAFLLAEEIEQKVNYYKSAEKALFHEVALKEIRNLDRIVDEVKGLKSALDIFRNDTRKKDQLLKILGYAYRIESAASEINKDHFAAIVEWEKQSLLGIRTVLTVNIVFFVLGAISVYLGHKFIYGNIVKPIKSLSDATIEFSNGSFDKRVFTESSTEIGLLYKSFNQMAEKIQHNDTLLRNLNEELEKKVEERTNEYQEAYEELMKTRGTLVRTEKIAAIGQMAAGVAHEIKNPLNSVSINIQMLLRKVQGLCGKKGCPHYDITELVFFEINRINEILDEFVKYARFPDPKFMLNDINQQMTEEADMISELAKASEVNVILETDDNIPEFNFDARQLKEVLMNLFQNAIKAMDKRGGDLTVKSFRQEENVIVTVGDTGKGIPLSDLEIVFTPFFTTREKGLGLGLSIVQRIIESHSGKIVCESEDGKGTIFTITIPLQRGKG